MPFILYLDSRLRHAGMTDLEVFSGETLMSTSWHKGLWKPPSPSPSPPRGEGWGEGFSSERQVDIKFEVERKKQKDDFIYFIFS